LREGAILVVTELDPMARSVLDPCSTPALLAAFILIAAPS